MPRCSKKMNLSLNVQPQNSGNKPIYRKKKYIYILHICKISIGKVSGFQFEFFNLFGKRNLATMLTCRFVTFFRPLACKCLREMKGRNLTESSRFNHGNFRARKLRSGTREWGPDQGGGRCVKGGPFFSMAKIGQYG